MYKRNPAFWIHVVVLVAVACSCHPGKKGIFGAKKSAHASYAERLEKAGLHQSEMARQWQIAAERGLSQPVPVSLPFKESGYFAADEPASSGYRVNGRRGANLQIAVAPVPLDTKNVFLELWKLDTVSMENDLLAEGDSTLHLNYEIEDDGIYIVRIQPELLVSMEYTLTMQTNPSLAFPVSEAGKPALISFWNDKRDAGRNHEGVDIRAAFRTPAVSAANAVIRSVTENRLGGKVVFLRPEGKNYTLYYAHLDTQLVSPGQVVAMGQPVGLVGNTGNAVNTPPHLHFGIYTRGGAVDPLPFIDNRVVQPKEITASTKYINQWVRTRRKTNITRTSRTNNDTIAVTAAGTPVKVLSAVEDLYKVQLASGRIGFLKSELLTDAPLTRMTTDTITRLLAEPAIQAAAKEVIPAGTQLSVHGETPEFYLVDHDTRKSWVAKRQ